MVIVFTGSAGVELLAAGESWVKFNVPAAVAE